MFSPIDGWDKFSQPYTKKEFGKWELLLPPKSDKSPAVDHNTKLKVENKTSSYLFSRPQKVSLCHGGARTCHCDAPGRFPAMCDEPSEKLACCCQQHAALTAWVGGGYCMYTVCTVKARYTWGAQLMDSISAPVDGRHPSGYCAKPSTWCEWMIGF